MAEQTILHDNPNRLGNCVAACVAEFLDLPLSAVPHFVEYGIEFSGDPDDNSSWWALLTGFMWAKGFTPVLLESVNDAHPEEIVFVSGPSPRGVSHQVLYRDGELWFDPHPSKAGLRSITEVMRWTRFDAFNHDPDFLPNETSRALFSRASLQED